MTCPIVRLRLNRWAVFLVGCIVSACGVSQATVVITNFNQPILGDTSSGTQVGAAVLVFNTAINVSSIQLFQNASGPTIGEGLAIFSRNADGTLGNSLFSDFTPTFNAISGIETATPNSALTLAANTGYWLVLSAGGSLVHWDFTSSPNYTANFGVTMPATDTTVVTDSQGTGYLSLASGPQLFEIDGTPVPEPSGLWLAAAAALAASLIARRPWPTTKLM